MHQGHVCWPLFVAAALAMAIAEPTPAQGDQVEVLADHFDNGQLTDSDAIAGFWRLVPDKQAKYTLTENNDSNGLLQLSIASDLPGATPKVMMRSTVTPNFNFAAGAITLSVKGIQIRSQGPGTQSHDSVIRFSFTSQTAHPWASPDAVTLLLMDTGPVIFGWKTGKPQADPIQVKAGTIDSKTSQSLGMISGFDLMLNATEYQLVLHGTKKDITLQGSYADKGGLTPWGNAALIVDFQRCTNNANITSHFQLDDLIVTQDKRE